MQAALRRWRPSLPPHCRGGGGGLLNFRELLWYWSEYYQRRGRDRLSLEFSSHIRFEEWHSLVGKSLSEAEREARRRRRRRGNFARWCCLLL
mgnify:CR=1 FL=1